MTNISTYHFIGVGGIGMSGLAELLVRQGVSVSGSDLAEGAITRRLAELGVRVHLGHRAENLGDADVVVHSTAVKEDNPELAAARGRGLRVLRRGELLADLMQNHTQVAGPDESDGSFALLSPEITIITNLDREHLDYYRDLAHVQEMFAAYLQRLPEGARGIACAGDPQLARGAR